jgi:hypothetical protein
MNSWLPRQTSKWECRRWVVVAAAERKIRRPNRYRHNPATDGTACSTSFNGIITIEYDVATVYNTASILKVYAGGRCSEAECVRRNYGGVTCSFSAQPLSSSHHSQPFQ